MKPLPLALLSSLALSACTSTASVLARSTMAPIPRACTVTELGYDRPDQRSPPRQSRWAFDARSLLVEHDYNPEYHSRARLLFRRDAAGRLLAIDYRYDRRAEDFPCASEDGCYVPALSAQGRVEIEYEGGRIVRRVDARSSAPLRIDSWQYDARGRLTQHDAPSGTERFEYDASPHVRRRAWSFSHGHGDELFVYDAANHLTEVQRQMCGSICGARQSRRLSYTAQGFLERVTHPEGSVETYQHDDAGRITARGDATSIRAWYRYDEAGRIRAWGAGEQPMREFRYDGACSNAAAINSAIVGEARSDSAARVDEAAMTPTFP
jgi:YD repeat-containing protein